MDTNTDWLEGCQSVLISVFDERVRQVARYGHNEDLEYGTGPNEAWVPTLPLVAHEIEEVFRRDYEQQGKPTWVRLVREEMAEAFQETDPVKLEEELLQVAALCVSWVEKIRSRNH